MTVPTHTLLKQLRGEVRWLHQKLMAANLYSGDQGHDHADAALDIVEELRDRDKYLPRGYFVYDHKDGVARQPGSEWVFVEAADLQRLHDLMLKAVGPMDIQTGAASCGAMDLIRRMIGGDK